MMVARGPSQVTAMGYSIHLIHPRPRIFCQCQVMSCNIHGRENIALTLKYVPRVFLK